MTNLGTKLTYDPKINVVALLKYYNFAKGALPWKDSMT